MFLDPEDSSESELMPPLRSGFLKFLKSEEPEERRFGFFTTTSDDEDLE